MIRTKVFYIDHFNNFAVAICLLLKKKKSSFFYGRRVFNEQSSLVNESKFLKKCSLTILRGKPNHSLNVMNIGLTYLEVIMRIHLKLPFKPGDFGSGEAFGKTSEQDSSPEKIFRFQMRWRHHRNILQEMGIN